MIGERLKHALIGGEAWIISYHYECFDKIGLKPSAKIPLFNGALPCELRKYEIFDGRYNDFRGGDRRLKKDDLPTRRSSTLRHKARLAEKDEERKNGFAENTELKRERPARRTSARKPFHEEGERRTAGRKPFRKDGEKSFRKDGDKPFRKSEGAKPFRKSEGTKPFRKTSSDGKSFSKSRGTGRPAAKKGFKKQ